MAPCWVCLFGESVQFGGVERETKRNTQDFGGFLEKDIHFETEF